MAHPLKSIHRNFLLLEPYHSSGRRIVRVPMIAYKIGADEGAIPNRSIPSDLYLLLPGFRA